MWAVQQQTQDTNTTLPQCWPSAYDIGTPLNQIRIDDLCLLGTFHAQHNRAGREINNKNQNASLENTEAWNQDSSTKYWELGYLLPVPMLKRAGLALANRGPANRYYTQLSVSVTVTHWDFVWHLHISNTMGLCRLLRHRLPTSSQQFINEPPAVR